MRVVVDHNVWISSFLNRVGAPARLGEAYLQGRFAVVTSEPLLRELSEVLRRPKFARRGVAQGDIAPLLFRLRDEVINVPAQGAWRLCRDPDDDALIETVVFGQADILVTGDKDLLAIAQVLAEQGIRALTVTAFLRVLDEE